MAGCRPLPALLTGLLALSPLGLGCAPAAEAAPRAARKAPPAATLREEVRARLSRPGPLPDTATWEALGPRLPATLAALARDVRMPLSLRQRAVATLGALPREDAGGQLERLATSQGLPTPLRTAAAEALGPREGEASLQVLRELLADTEAAVRTAAAHALGTRGTPEARAVLEQAVSAEQDAAVREALQQALTRMQL